MSNVQKEQLTSLRRLLAGPTCQGGIGKHPNSPAGSALGITDGERWERGLSRPRDKEIPLLATAWRLTSRCSSKPRVTCVGAVGLPSTRHFRSTRFSADSFDVSATTFSKRLYREKTGALIAPAAPVIRRMAIDISVVGPFERTG